jgi:hypothetical protein
VVCWGRSFEFNTGRPSTDTSLQQNCTDGVSLCQPVLPVPMPAAFASIKFTRVSARDTGACALTSTGRVVCWGDLMTLDQQGQAAAEIPLAP